MTATGTAAPGLEPDGRPRKARFGRSILDGEGSAYGHHGELLQGVFEVAGRLHRGLATLPCPVFTSTARVTLVAGQSKLTVDPPWKTKALRAVGTTLQNFGLPPMGGSLELASNVDVSRGFGSSSSDVTAAIRAVLAALGQRLPQERMAAIAVQAEAAADPLMFDRMVLFAHREGHLLEDFRLPMCPVDVLGFSLGYPEVDTLTLRPARYNAWEIECFRTLRGLLRRALIRRDLTAVGRVATASARINQRFLPVPEFDDLIATMNEFGATGLQVAHSGNIGGLLFDPGDPDLESRISGTRRRLVKLGLAEAWRYGIRSDHAA